VPRSAFLEGNRQAGGTKTYSDANREAEDRRAAGRWLIYGRGA
jgi:hypothetical protein